VKWIIYSSILDQRGAQDFTFRSAGDFYLKQARVKSIETAHPDDSDHLVFDCDFRMEQKKASHENK